ncbi:MAG: 4-hydroxythreonine-4-phosphate dehydrogenase PdxA [Candidatus Bathyarchaeota archaeon]|nr:4-hydroxythreonine-4-phosphate dehydrogenase PdxA [Candidatus Bathyarchaeota archaeon]
MKPIIAITMGDAAGIGPEIIAKALSLDEVYSVCRPFVVGDAGAMAMGIEVAELSLRINRVGSPSEALFKRGVIDVLSLDNIDASDLVMGRAQAMAGKASVEYVVRAAEMAMRDEVDAIVTAPLNKEAMNMAGYRYPGHTELLAEIGKTQDYAMMLLAGGLRVVHVTTHVSLRAVPDLITKDRVFKKIRVAHEAARSLGFDRPRIGVAGLNPHSGEGGLFGREEIEVISPAIDEARKAGMIVEGPVPPDTVFSKALGGVYDVVVAMYHDQGHIPVKLQGFRLDEKTGRWEDVSGVNMTVGLPFIRTSVDHGTAYGKAGRREGTANPQSLVDAIRIAAQMAEVRLGKKTA